MLPDPPSKLRKMLERIARGPGEILSPLAPELQRDVEQQIVAPAKADLPKFLLSMVGPGNLGGVPTGAAAQLFRGSTREAHEAAVKSLAALVDKTKAYRGMTKAEYDATLGAGRGVRSRQDFSVSGEGTSFADDIADAESYANFGRDDPRTTGLPTYLAEVNRSAKLRRDPRDGYLKAAEEIPPQDVSRVWRMEGDKEGNITGSLMDAIRYLNNP